MSQIVDADVADAELAHEPPDDETWQESLVIFWADRDLGIGGFHRVGHEPNRGHGDLWCGLTTPAHRFRRDSDLVAIGPDDRTAPNYGLEGHRFTLTDEGMRFTVDEPDVALDLLVEDLSPMAPIYHPDGLKAVGRATVSNHLENHGRVRGTLAMGGERFEVDGLCVRDHSWGPRDWSAVLSHRWVAGTFGPDLGFSALVMQGMDHEFLSMGVVVRDGELVRARSLDIVVHLESDGVSHRGGALVMQLEDDTELAMEIETYDGWIFDAYSHVEVDTVCWVTSADGRRGVCDLEVSNGRRIPEVRVGLRAATADGLTPQKRQEM